MATGEREGAIDFGPLETFVGFNMRVAQDLAIQIFAKHTGARHARPGRYAALKLIQLNPGLTQIDLSRSIARDKSSVTTLVQGLQRDGLIKRQVSEADRRVVTLTLTKAGEKALVALDAHALEHERKLGAILGEDKERFLGLLKRIARNLA